MNDNLFLIRQNIIDMTWTLWIKWYLTLGLNVIIHLVWLWAIYCNFLRPHSFEKKDNDAYL